MGAPNDPSIIWPDSFQDPGPIDPRLYALVMRQAMGAPGALNLSPDVGLSADDDEMAPQLMAARVLSDYVASQKAQGAGPPDQTAWASNSTPAPASTAIASPDAPDDDAFSPSADLPDTVQTPPQGGGALSAESAAVPASAAVPTNRSSSTAAMQPQDSMWTPTGQFLRPELSGGPDSLVAALAGDHPGANPFGFVVDPKSGAVSYWRARMGADALGSGQMDLVPVSPQQKQTYLEWLTGARANYPLGQVSPQEQAARSGLLMTGAPTDDHGLPISATASGKVVTYTNRDGTTRSVGGHHPDRDNNPLNLGPGSTATRHGALGRDGRNAIFPSPQQALEASWERMDQIARTYPSRSGQPAGSLANIVYIWSPPSENPTEDMIRHIMHAAGLDRNTNWDALTVDQKRRFINAYSREEGFTGIGLP